MKMDLFFNRVARWYSDRFAASKLLRFNETKSDTTKPTAPASLTAPTKGPTHATLVWTAATDTNLANYALYCNGQFLYTVAGVQVDVDHLIPDSTYHWKVTAIDRYGNESDPSPELTFNTLPRP